MNPKAIILLSGGIDSSTTLAIARDRGYNLYALTVNYGQRHHIELDAAKRVAKAIGVILQKLIKVDLRAFGGSALTDDIDVPKGRLNDTIEGKIPSTYVPARNTIFLSLALGWAEVIDARHIFIGVNALDYSGYPDCRPEFIEAFQRMANLATRDGVEGRLFTIETPIIDMTKAEIIRLGVDLGLDYSLTHSCYDPTPEGISCGQCDSCIIRRRGFIEAGVPDPTKYVN
ncbi:MAG: 7-cyano-7-deazaguanine synthase QueC [Candidatus Hatepunaea meridiana]|nr:7-cyano-7-deazaguanine synthase QueC [Candidatus Hatepunaea meridiana]